MNSETPSGPSLRLGAKEKIYLPRLASALGPTRDSPEVVQTLLRLAQADGADARLIYSLASQMRARYDPYPWEEVAPDAPISVSPDSVSLRSPSAPPVTPEVEVEVEDYLPTSPPTTTPSLPRRAPPII